MRDYNKEIAELEQKINELKEMQTSDAEKEEKAKEDICDGISFILNGLTYYFTDEEISTLFDNILDPDKFIGFLRSSLTAIQVVAGEKPITDLLVEPNTKITVNNKGAAKIIEGFLKEFNW